MDETSDPDSELFFNTHPFHRLIRTNVVIR